MKPLPCIVSLIYQLFEFSNIVDMSVYFLFIKFSMLSYFNYALFKVVYLMMCFFTVALLMSYCLLALNVFFFQAALFSMMFFLYIFKIISFFITH